MSAEDKLRALSDADLRATLDRARRFLDDARAALFDERFCSLSARPGNPGAVVDGGRASVVVPGGLVSASRALEPYGVPTLRPSEHPSRDHPEGRALELEAKRYRADGRAMVSGPGPRALVGRADLTVAANAAEELARVAEALLAERGATGEPDRLVTIREAVEILGEPDKSIRRWLDHKHDKVQPVDRCGGSRGFSARYWLSDILKRRPLRDGGENAD